LDLGATLEKEEGGLILVRKLPKGVAELKVGSPYGFGDYLLLG